MDCAQKDATQLSSRWAPHLGKRASLCCNYNTVFVTALVCNTCTYPLAPYFWVFAFILSSWTVLCPVRNASFFSLLSADVLAVENGDK